MNTLNSSVLSRPPSLASLAEGRLREAIENAEFQLGESLSEDKLATFLGVSRTPVREALNSLSLQGLVEIFPQRGSYVFSPSGEEVQAV
jgi:DNA-binding GntR family transcriptional regulator